MSSLDHLTSARRVLMLQGPMGGFFRDVASWLRQQGIVCYKINFNGGDRWFFSDDFAIDYRGTLQDFQDWLDELVQKLNIDTIVCFGDCRLYHVEAAKFCQNSKVDFLVFEEGYLRPDYITLEIGGVNAFSNIHPSQIEQHAKAHDQPIKTEPSFALMVWSACWYYLAWIAMQRDYPNYQHHRLLTPSQEIVAWGRALRRRITNYVPDHYKKWRIDRDWAHNYFVVALQVHNDSQVRVHSQYADVSDFIVETLESFAQHAASRHTLVIKHHPMDRGYRNYRQLIRCHAERLGIERRVRYVCDVHLPSLIKKSLGLITINSTTGLQALFHAKPVKVMGSAIYDIPRLTTQKDLHEFWRAPCPVDRDYYLRFRELLLEQTQLNGSFYGLSPWMDSPMDQNNRRHAVTKHD